MRYSPRREALKDISKWIKDYNILTHVLDEVWFVTPIWLDNKEQRRLNRELKLNSINMNKYNMSRK